jgi:4-methylaminobutanoate oxidase (formaldehyde-forming)
MWGPRARDILSQVTDDDVSDAGFPFFGARSLHIGGAEVWAQRITYVGELGWELYLDPSWAVQVWDRLWDAGAGYGVRAVGYRALDALRMEKGYRYFGTDLTPLATPYETGLGAFVALGKGEFEGRNALAEASARTPERQLRTLLVGGEEYLTIYGGEAVSDGRDLVGRLSSCAYGYTVGRNVAYSMLPSSAEIGDRFDVDVFGERVPAEVAADVLHDPERIRPTS